MESSNVSVCEAVSSVLSMLEEQRKLAYTQSGIQLVTEVDNKYPLSDVIMSSYTGQKKNGLLEGYGTVEFKDGHTYQGNFHQGVMHGQGQYSWTDGLVYEGEFSDCKITGVGKYTWSDGSTYTGQVKNGLRHGQGTYWCALTGSTYTGQWVAGKREGRGRIDYSSSQGEESQEESYYDGDWVNNQQEGFGMRKYKSGNVYEGEWLLNERHGKGTMHWYDMGECYTGEWVKGIQHGQGEHMWIIQGSDNAQYPLCNRYDGNWDQGKREGFGTFYYANGSKYIGEWVQDLKHGKGKFVFQNGQVFEGQFQKDRMLSGTTSDPETSLLRPKTPLGSLIGDIDHSDIVGGGSTTEKFNLEISRLLPEGNLQHELRQIHCVLMRHITQLKKIYHYYSALGSYSVYMGDKDLGHCSTLNQMQLWRLLMDCGIHRQGIALHDVDYIIHPDAPPNTAHDPHQTFLMREFLQLLVFLSNHLISDHQEARVGDLSQKLSSFINKRLLPNACSVGGTLYSKPIHCTVQALGYQQEVWQLYQQIQSTTTGLVKLRDCLLLLKECGLVTSKFPASSVVRELVKNRPQAVDDEDYNLEIKVVFLEFFEILLQCAQEWFRLEGKMKIKTANELEVSLPTLVVTSSTELNKITDDGEASPVHLAAPSDGVSPRRESTPAQSITDLGAEQQEKLEEEGRNEGEADDEETQPSPLQEVEDNKEDVMKHISVVADKEFTDTADIGLSWGDMLHAFFAEHLLSELN